jgi:hypothetical protein
LSALRQPQNAEELRKRYKEPTRSQTYIDRCILLADCCVSLRQQSTDKLNYFYQTEADYLLERGYCHFILEGELIHPTLVFCKDKYGSNGKEETTLESYLLEVFDPTLPRSKWESLCRREIGILRPGDFARLTLRTKDAIIYNDLHYPLR